MPLLALLLCRRPWAGGVLLLLLLFRTFLLTLPGCHHDLTKSRMRVAAGCPSFRPFSWSAGEGQACVVGGGIEVSRHKNAQGRSERK